MAVKRIALRGVAALAAVAVVIAGFLLVHGDFQRWYGNAKLDDACDGLLDGNAVRAVLGDGSVDIDDEQRDPGMVGCTVHVSDDKSSKITIVDTTHLQEPLDWLYGSRGEDTLAVPLGYGWAGLFGAQPDTFGSDSDPLFPGEDEDMTASLVLRCAGTSKITSVYVSVVTTLDSTLDDPGNRPQFTRIATSTAAEVSKAWDCAAKLGKPVHSLGLPVRQDEYRPLGEADGTCSGISAARDVTIATETARAGAPHETCRLSGADRQGGYVLDADFGPYAQGQFLDYEEKLGIYGEPPSADIPAHLRDHADEMSWTTAKCPEGLALFTLRPAQDRDEEHESTRKHANLAYERATLKAFAERSAKSHGCAAPATL